MEISHEKTSSIGFGYSTLADAFQAGREAAQMAKTQFPDAATDLALAIGPADIHFKDFIEGVRLVIGENGLIGIPAAWVLSSDAPNRRVRTVLLLKSEGQRVSVASTTEDENALVASTSLFSDLRARRGNARLDYDCHGLIAIDSMRAPRRFLAHHMAGDAGLESWVAGFGISTTPVAAMTCGPQRLNRGIAAIECLSNAPWGLGWVDTSAFPADAAVRREAGRSSMREALAQLHARRPAAGLMLVASGDDGLSEADADALFKSAVSAAPSVPLIGLPIREPYLRSPGGALATAKEGVLSLLVPL